MKIQNIGVAALMFSFCILAGTSFYGAMSRDYGNTAKLDESKYAEIAGDISGQVSEMSVNASGDTDSGFRKALTIVPGAETVFSSFQFVSSTFSVLFSADDIVKAVVADTIESLGITIPWFVGQYIDMAIALMVFFALFGAWIKWKV